MKRQKSWQRGSIAVIVLAIIFVIILATTAWLVWQKTSSNGKGSTNSSQAPADKEAARYLTIKEWDVKVPLSESIMDAYYEFQSQGDGEFVALYDAGFDSRKNSNGVSCGGDNRYQFYSMSRIKKDELPSIEVEGAEALYRTFPFTDQYLFSGLRAHQSAPPCGHLNLDPDSPPQNDTEIFTIANQKEEAFDKAFDGLQLAE